MKKRNIAAAERDCCFVLVLWYQDDYKTLIMAGYLWSSIALSTLLMSTLLHLNAFLCFSLEEAQQAKFGSTYARVSTSDVIELRQLQQPRRLLGKRPVLDHSKLPRLATFSAVEGIRVELLQRDHEKSPLREDGTSTNRTLEDRIRRDVERSTIRANYISRSIGAVVAAASGEVSVQDFKSPLSATLAEYVMSISLGTPPQKFAAIVDTGSDLVWLQCSPCLQCFKQPNAVFNSDQSSSYRDLTCSDARCHDLDLNLDSCSPNCQYTYTYGDQSSTSGDFSAETITLETIMGESQAIPNFAFGCGHKNQGTFSSTDGLVGLGQGPASFSSQLGSLFGNKFSYCLVNREEALSQTSPLLFGNVAVPSGGMLQFTPMLPNTPGIGTFYYVGLEGLSIGGSQLDIPSNVFARDSSGSGGTIFDSGTTFTQLVSTAYDAVINAFQLALPYPQVLGSRNVGLDLCFDIMGVQNVVVPELTFHFSNANFDLPADNFFVLVDNARTMCLAISRSSSALTIFGNTQQQNFQILYDRQNARIGFIPTKCSTL